MISLFVQWGVLLTILLCVRRMCSKYLRNTHTERVGNVITAVGFLLITGIYGVLAVEYPSKNRAPLTPQERFGVQIEDNGVRYIPVREYTSPAQTYQELREAAKRETTEQLKNLRAAKNR